MNNNKKLNKNTRIHSTEEIILGRLASIDSNPQLIPSPIGASNYTLLILPLAPAMLFTKLSSNEIKPLF